MAEGVPGERLRMARVASSCSTILLPIRELDIRAACQRSNTRTADYAAKAYASRGPAPFVVTRRCGDV